MAIRSDVLVIGGGLAGSMAALAAARAGVDVRILADGESTLGMATGLIDVLGYVDGEGPVVDPFAAISDLPAAHPYRLLGADTVREALATFDEAVPGYRGGHTDDNALVVTHGGTVKPTARYPESVASGLASAPGDVLLVGFETLMDLDAPLAADHLAATGVPFETTGVTLRFPGDPPADAKATWYATMLEEDRPVVVDGQETGTRAALGDRIARVRDDQEQVGLPERVGLPAVLGMDSPHEVRADLAARIGAAVFEIPMGPPSLPGHRLATRLDDALDAAGVFVDRGNRVVDHDGEDRIERVHVDREGARIPYAAEEYVLATGGLVGRGVETDPGTVREPVFDCHVPHPDDRYEWSADRPFDEHGFARFGVHVDEDLRPRNADGVVEYHNLRAAGGVIGGYDFAAEKSGSGVSIATGHVAGQGAADAVTAATPTGGEGT